MLLPLVQLGVVLVGINCLVFQKELTIEDSLPIPPYVSYHLIWMKTVFCCGWWWRFGFGEYVTPSFILWLLNRKSQVKRNPNLHGDPGCLKRVLLQIIFIVQEEYLEPHRELGWVCCDDVEG